MIMKHINKYIFASATLIAFASAFSSCKNEEDDIFDASAAERLEQAKTENHNLLCAAPNGWAMQYFADNTDEGGYTFLMKFDKNTSVKIAANSSLTGNVYEEETSMFDVIADYGPVLTFNSYNSIFHQLADPYDVPSLPGDESGYGHRGDYEFIIMDATADRIELRGKKHGKTIIMTALDADTDWETYFSDLTAFSNSLFDSRLDPLVLDVNGEKYTLTGSNTGVFNAVPDGGDAISQTTKIPFIVNDKGIRFGSPFEGLDENFSVESFILDEEGKLVSDEGDPAIIQAYGVPAETFMLKKCVWSIDMENLGGEFVSAFQAVADDCNTALKRNFLGINFAYDKKERSSEESYMFSFLISGTSAKAYLYSDFKISESGNFGFNISLTEGNTNGMNRVNRIAALTDLVNLLNSSEYKVTSDDPIKRTTLKFESVSKPENTFYVTLK